MSINFVWSQGLEVSNANPKTEAKQKAAKEKRLAALRAKATEALKPTPKPKEDKPKRTARANARKDIRRSCLSIGQQFAAWLCDEEKFLSFLLELRSEENGKGNGYCVTAASAFSSAFDDKGAQAAHFPLLLSFLTAHMTDSERTRLSQGGIVDITALATRACKVRTLKAHTGVVFLTFRDYLSLFVGGKLTTATMVDGKKVYRLRKWSEVSHADLIHSRKVMSLKAGQYPALPA